MFYYLSLSMVIVKIYLLYKNIHWLGLHFYFIFNINQNVISILEQTIMRNPKKPPRILFK